MTSTVETLSRQLAPRAWIFDLARGVLSILIALSVLVWREQTLGILVFLVAIYILVDGLFDILVSVRDRHQRNLRRAHLVIGVFSCAAAFVALVDPQLSVRIIILYVAFRTASHGVMDLWELATSFRRRNANLLLLLRGVILLLISVALVIAPLLVAALFVNIFVAFLVIDGIGYLASAALKGGLVTPKPGRQAYASSAASTVAAPPRAVVFVRRSGARGMGHVGWAFEWGTGWFNAGSIENGSGAAFSPPDKMDFWTAHTIHPVATMMEQSAPYDEYKVFQVTDPHPKDAWKTIVWLSRQPYSVLRRNCSDCAFDVLRSYGVPRLVDTAQENLPNEWYDKQPGQSYVISERSEIPLDPAKAARITRLSVQEIHLKIPKRIEAEPPPWRASGGRAWHELSQRWLKTSSDARAFVGDVFARIGQSFHQKSPSPDA